MVPPPRKPIPATIYEAIRVGSMVVWGMVRSSKKPYAEMIVKRAQPSETSQHQIVKPPLMSAW